MFGEFRKSHAHGHEANELEVRSFYIFNFKKQSNVHVHLINIWESCQVVAELQIGSKFKVVAKLQIGSKFISQDANTVDPRYLDFGHLE